MGDKNNKPKRIHLTPLFGGKATAEEVWIAALNKPCYACKAPGVTLFRTLVLWTDVMTRRPDVAGAILARSEDGRTPPLIKTKFGGMVCIAELTACKACTATAEKAAAAGEKQYEKAGIGCLVEIRRGPGADKPVFQNPLSSSDAEASPAPESSALD